MKKTKREEQIDQFWKWFEQNSDLVKAVIAENAHPKTEYIINSLDEHILEMGKLKWEILNPTTNQYVFTVSPNNSSELLQITKDIVVNSPNMEGWAFYPAMQPVESVKNVFKLQLYDGNMDVQNVDAKTWKIALEPTPEKKVNLFFEAQNIPHLDEDTKKLAAELMLTGILGEELKINTISNIEISTQFHPKHKGKCFAIQGLIKEILKANKP